MSSSDEEVEERRRLSIPGARPPEAAAQKRGEPLAAKSPQNSAKPSRAEEPAETGGYEIVFEAADGLVAISGPCVLIRHFCAPTAAIVLAMGRAYAKAAERWERVAHLCTITTDSGILPTSEVRDALQAVMMRFDKRLVSAAIVYEGTGFKATMVRSVVTGLCMVARTTHPTRVFTHEAEACAWVAQSLSLAGLPPCSELCNTMTALRRRRALPG